jgi:dihydroxy-acid dehydratase
MTGRHKGERLGACTDCRRFWAQYRAGKIDGEEISQIEGRLAVTTGTCAVMGTASTMAIIAEALGMTLPDSAAIPAVHADRLRVAEETGKLAAQMTNNGRKPTEIISRQSIENALRLLLAVSGSTNAVIHLAAIAGRLGFSIDPDRFNSLSDETPVLVNLKPVGDGYMEDFHEAGGVGAVMRELKNLLDLDVQDVTGQRLADRLDKPAEVNRDDRYIKARENPVDPLGGLIILRGSLAPEGAVLKRAAASPHLLEHEGRAIVFSSL